eukprot:Gb_29882 [translate_table: standard]
MWFQSMEGITGGVIGSVAYELAMICCFKRHFGAVGRPSDTKVWRRKLLPVAITCHMQRALAVGYFVGGNTKGTRIVAFGGALALGVVGGITAYALNSTAPRIVIVNLHNKVVNCGHPSTLNKEEIDSILNKYGVSK